MNSYAFRRGKKGRGRSLMRNLLQVQQRQEVTKIKLLNQVTSIRFNHFSVKSISLFPLKPGVVWQHVGQTAKAQKRVLHIRVVLLWQKGRSEGERRREWGNRHVRQISTVSASSLPPKTDGCLNPEAAQTLRSLFTGLLLRKLANEKKKNTN